MLVRFSLTSLSSTLAMVSDVPPSWGPFLLPRLDLNHQKIREINIKPGTDQRYMRSSPRHTGPVSSE